MNRKKILVWSILLSIILFIIISKPWLLDGAYSSARSYAMGLCGHIAMVIIIWQVILGIRPLSSAWLGDFFWVNNLHKWLWVATLSLIIMHPVFVVISYATNWLYAVVWDFSSSFETWVTLGKIACNGILAILLSSILSRKILSFRSWYRLHLLSYPIYVWLWLHGRYTGTMIMNNQIIHRYRLGLGIFLVMATVVRIAYQFGYLKHKAKLLGHRQLTPDIFELRFELDKNIQYIPGQFIYLQMNQWGESHPFTVLSYENSIITITYKVFWRYTKVLSQCSPMSHPVMYIDGPYGIFTQNIANKSKIVCIAWWIGVTPFIQLIKDYPKKDISILMLNKYRSDIIYHEHVASYANKYMHILSREQWAAYENEIIWRRLDIDTLRSFIGTECLDTYFYLCWWGSVIINVTNMLISLGVPESNMQREPFEM